MHRVAEEVDEEEEKARTVLDKLRRIARQRKRECSLTEWKQRELLDSLSRLYLWIHGFPEGRMGHSLLEVTGIQEVVRDLLSSIAAAGEKLETTEGRPSKIPF